MAMRFSDVWERGLRNSHMFLKQVRYSQSQTCLGVLSPSLTGLHRGSRSYFEPPLVCLGAACIRSSRSLHREGLADQRHFAADRGLSRGLMKAPSFLLTVRCAVSTGPYRPTRLRW